MGKRISLDTQILIDCVLSLPSLEALLSDCDLEAHKMLIPIYVLSETKRVLISKYNFDEQRAKTGIDKLVKVLKAEVIRSDENDKKGAKYLLELHSDVEDFHEEDALIIACLKRSRVNICYCRDKAASEVMKKEGIDVRRLPTIDRILDKRLQQLLLIIKSYLTL
jgi:predicted nucleic acid-binding protein